MDTKSTTIMFIINYFAYYFLNLLISVYNVENYNYK